MRIRKIGKIQWKKMDKCLVISMTVKKMILLREKKLNKIKLIFPWQIKHHQTKYSNNSLLMQ